MSETIRVNYAALQDMSKHCSAVAERLRQTAQTGRKIAEEITNGAMVGDTGSVFSAALNGPFSASVLKLSQKFDEVAKDINDAISDMQAADKSAGSSF